MTYSIDFRKKVLSIREKEGLSFIQIAKRFDISPNSVFLWSKKLEPKSTRTKPTIKIHNENLLEDIEKYPDAYNYERARRLNVSTTGIYWALKRLGITYKKNSKTSKGLRAKTSSLYTKNRRA
jgi:transposase